MAYTCPHPAPPAAAAAALFRCVEGGNWWVMCAAVCLFAAPYVCRRLLSVDVPVLCVDALFTAPAVRRVAFMGSTTSSVVAEASAPDHDTYSLDGISLAESEAERQGFEW
jgi:hypothetical protein